MSIKKGKIGILGIQGIVRAKGIKDGKVIWEDVRENVVCKAGLARLAKILADEISDASINRCALGTGAGSASTNDTTLETEGYRNIPASKASSNEKVLITAYYGLSEGSTTTYTEFGVFIDGTDDADSGYLFNHLTGLSWAKDGSTEIQVDVEFTLQDV